MSARYCNRAIVVTSFGWWHAARQRLVEHLDGKCIDGVQRQDNLDATVNDLTAGVEESQL